MLSRLVLFQTKYTHCRVKPIKIPCPIQKKLIIHCYFCNIFGFSNLTLTITVSDDRKQIQRRNQKIYFGEALSPFPLSPFLPSPLPFPSLPSPPLPLEVGPPNPIRGSGAELPQRGLGRSPSRNRIWCNYCILVLKSDIWWQQF